MRYKHEIGTQLPNGNPRGPSLPAAALRSASGQDRRLGVGPSERPPWPKAELGAARGQSPSTQQATGLLRADSRSPRLQPPSMHGEWADSAKVRFTILTESQNSAIRSSFRRSQPGFRYQCGCSHPPLSSPRETGHSLLFSCRIRIIRSAVMISPALRACPLDRGRLLQIRCRKQRKQRKRQHPGPASPLPAPAIPGSSPGSGGPGWG